MLKSTIQLAGKLTPSAITIHQSSTYYIPVYIHIRHKHSYSEINHKSTIASKFLKLSGLLSTGVDLHSIAMSSKRIPGSRNIQTWLAVQTKTVCNFHTSHKNSDILYDNIRNDKRNTRLYEALI